VSFDLYVFPPPGPSTSGQVRALMEAEERRLMGDEEGELPVQGPAMKAFIEDLERSWPSLEEDPDASPWSSWPLWQPMIGGGTALNIRWSQAEMMRSAVIAAAARASVIVYDPQADQLIPPPNKRRGIRLFGRRP
jgi:hypothetical protein